MNGDRVGDGGVAVRHGVSDEVWREIAVEGDRAAAGERRAMFRAAVVVAVLIVGTTALLLSGVVTPRLSGGNSAGGGGGGPHNPYFVEFTLHNDGITPVDLVGWTSRLDGVEVVGSSPAGVQLAPRGAQDVRVTFRTTDCAAAVPAARAATKRSPMSGAGLGVVIDRPWGDMASTVHPIMAIEDLVLASCGEDVP